MGVTRLPLILACALASGCASSARQQQANDDLKPAPRHYAPAAASALAFDSTVAPAYPLLGLDRAAREPGAYMGYQDGVAEYFSVGIDDNFTNDPASTTYQRESTSVKVGVRYR